MTAIVIMVVIYILFISPGLGPEPCKWVTGSLLPPTFAAERGNQELTEEKSKYQLRPRLGPQDLYC